MRSLPLCAMALCCAGLLTSPALAQYGGLSGPGVFTGMGEVAIERPAKRMRMVVEIAGNGASIKDAAKALQDQLGQAREAVVVLGADEKSIKSTDPKIKEVDNSQQQRMLDRIRQQLGRGGRAKNVEVPQVLTLKSRLTAEWDLPAGDAFAQLAKVHELQQALRKAELAGKAGGSQLTPEEQELLAESMFMDDSSESQTGEPSFVFLAAVTEAERASAIKSAYEQARAEAQRLASAIGAPIGKLESLQVDESGAVDEAEDSIYNDYGSSRYRMMQSLLGPAGDHEKGVAFGTAPGTLKFMVRVSAGFSQ